MPKAKFWSPNSAPPPTANGQVLSSDDTKKAGLKWVTPGPNYVVDEVLQFSGADIIAGVLGTLAHPAQILVNATLINISVGGVGEAVTAFQLIPAFYSIPDPWSPVGLAVAALDTATAPPTDQLFVKGPAPTINAAHTYYLRISYIW